MYWLGLVAAFLAISVTVVAFTFYGRGREQGPKADNWTMLFATWRDSMIVTLLYTSQSFLYRFSEFNGMSEIMALSPLLYPPIVQPVLTFVLDILIFMVVVMRVIALSRWLSQAPNTSSDDGELN